MKRVILIDAHAIIHRAYHALPPLSTPAGEPINAVYGFTTILLRILREFEPDYITAAFDLSGPTFRHIAYERYKAHRPETPSDLSGQFVKTEELLAAFGIPVFKKEGYEADDIIGTIVKKLAGSKNTEVIIVTGDMDTLQLVRPGVKVYAMKRGITDTVIYDEKAVFERYGLEPNQLIDFKGLKGDASDNIPGVKGIGEKTATDLIKKFGSIEKLYQALDKNPKSISESVAVKLRAGREEARFSRELSTINLAVPIEFNLESTAWSRATSTDRTKNVFQKFGFFSLLKRLEKPALPERVGEQAVLGVVAPRPGRVSIKKISSWKELHSNKEAGLVVHESSLYIVLPRASEIYEAPPDLLKTREAKSFFAETAFTVYDAKSVLHFLRRYGMDPLLEFDIMLASYVVFASSRDFSYASIITRELGRAVADDIREEFVHIHEIRRLLEAKISKLDLKKIFFEIEMPLVRVLADMEERGILIDQKFLRKLGGKVGSMAEELTQEIYKKAGGQFNINSPKQLSSILFEKLGIKTYGLRKTDKGGVISTRESELVKLADQHPIIAHILRYRELTKLLSTYIDVLPKLADSKTKRIHTTFHQVGTVTGRLSSSDPNLQNIPIMSEIGREIRKAFIPADGYDLVSFDYSQIELRVAAHIANDPKMIAAFASGMDIHRLTAAEIYNVPVASVTADQRRAAKTLNFGVLYGMGALAFSEATGFSLEEAKKFIQEYFTDFAGILDYIVRTKRFAEAEGYVETLFGRKRPMPEMASSNWQMKREAERMAINMPIQGTTADLVKLAMIRVDAWIKENKLGGHVRPLLQVHDELVFELKKERTKKIAPEIKKIMEGVIELKVPLVVDVKIGSNWGESGEGIGFRG